MIRLQNSDGDDIALFLKYQKYNPIPDAGIVWQMQSKSKIIRKIYLF